MTEPFLRFVFFSVGRGNNTLVSLPPSEEGGYRRYGVIDSNQSDVRILRAYLDCPWFPEEHVDPCDPFCFEFVALTHYDGDHFNGLANLLGGMPPHSENKRSFYSKFFLYPIVPPKLVALTKYSYKSDYAQQLLEIYHIVFDPPRLKLDNRRPTLPLMLAYDNHLESIIAPNGVLAEHPFKLKALAPSAFATDRILTSLVLDRAGFGSGNILSSALRFQFGNAVVLIGGDVMDNEWGIVLGDYANANPNSSRELGMTVVQVPHHGGTGNPEILWEIISRSSLHRPTRIKGNEGWNEENRRKPTLAVISCGERDPSLPSQETLMLLEKHGVQILCTAVNAHCSKEYEAKGHEVPCESIHGEPIADQAIGLPMGMQKTSGFTPQLPDALRKLDHIMNLPRRSICVDVFPSGKIEYGTHGFDGCKWPHNYSTQ